MASPSNKEAELRKAFIEFDTDGSGMVTLEEALTVLRKEFPEVSESYLKSMMKAKDINKDQKLEYKEFCKFHDQMKERKDKILKEFEKLDNGDGKLDKDEAHSKMIEVFDDVEMADWVFESFDEDGDGFLTRAE